MPLAAKSCQKLPTVAKVAKSCKNTTWLQMYRRTDGRTYGHTDGRTYGRTDIRTDVQMDVRTYGRTGGLFEPLKIQPSTMKNESLVAKKIHHLRSTSISKYKLGCIKRNTKVQRSNEIIHFLISNIQLN